MHATYHFNDANELTIDFIESIRLAFGGRAIKITVEEATDETTFLLAKEANRDMLLKSIEEDKGGIVANAVNL